MLIILDALDSSPSLTPHLLAVSKPATILFITSAEYRSVKGAPLTDLYSADVINNIVAGLDTANRWGVKEGELSRASKIINNKFINRITRQYIDDQLTLDEAVDEINTVLASF